MLVLTQYKSHSLHKHLRDGWSVFNPELREYITPVPAERLSRAPTSITRCCSRTFSSATAAWYRIR
jgi:ADP-glucose pyrophosphorylase